MNIERDQLPKLREVLNEYVNVGADHSTSDIEEQPKDVQLCLKLIERIDAALAPRVSYECCRDCGCTDIEVECWVNLATDEVGDSAGDEYWCPQCEDHHKYSHQRDNEQPYDGNADLDVLKSNYKRFINGVKPKFPTNCPNCNKPCETVNPEITRLHERVAPGEPMPLGECWDCGALVQAEPANDDEE